MPKQNQCNDCTKWFDRNSPTQKRCTECIEKKNSVPKKKYVSNRFYNKICEHCNNQYVAKEYKSKYCYKCKEKITTECPCGCEKKFSRSRMKIDKNPYWTRHEWRGKTYLEIYGNKTPQCGFKKGLDNPNFTCLRSKNFSTLKCLNSIGQRFRSKLEVSFSEFCIKNDIPYINEVIVNLIDGKRKIVDFVIYDSIIVEISGFVTPLWKSRFIEKMKILRQSVLNPILILSYNFNLNFESSLYECKNDGPHKCTSPTVLINSIQDLHKSLKDIKFINNINYLNNIISPNYIESIKLDYNSYKTQKNGIYE